MKKILINITCLGFFIIAFLFLGSCNKDFLDQEPMSEVTPDNYLVEESQLAAYAVTCYSELRLLDNGGYERSIADYDNNTDNQANIYPDIVRYVPGLYKVNQTGGDWNFTDIYNCNYFLQNVLPKWKNGEISGNTDNINHYIGEVYFLRAYAYFRHLQYTGDFPIVRTVLPDIREVLIDASKRAPRNEVARFILSDLDSAIMLLKTVAPDGVKNRISKPCAQLFSSRVALFEATWEKYFKGTAFVPNGPGWPGKEKDYNSDYNFPSGSIDGEISFFLDKAIENSRLVAEAVPTLVTNAGYLQQSPSQAINPYYDMFAQTDMSRYSEVLLWKKFDLGLGVGNGNNEILQNSRVGITRGMVDCFLMQNGLPIYDPASGYAGDDSIPAVKSNRDQRLQLFLKEMGQKNVLYFSGQKNNAVPIQPYSPIVPFSGYSRTSVLGYDIRKGLNFDDGTCVNNLNTTGNLIFRAVEAYLNYIEATYEKNGVIDGDADKYWRSIRSRAGIDPDYNKTIAVTDMSKEALNDWGAYSTGQLIDATLYNIRRERRCELMAEGFRYMDLIRWRAMDQMISTPYHLEGFKLWGPAIQYHYPATSLKYGKGNQSTVSDPALSLYLRPNEIVPTSIAYNGYSWNMAHYLSPIAVQHIQITSKDGNDVTTSPIYQNPGWPIVAGQGATD